MYTIDIKNSLLWNVINELIYYVHILFVQTDNTIHTHGNRVYFSAMMEQEQESLINIPRAQTL